MNPYAVSGYLRELPLEPAAHPADLNWRDHALCIQADAEQWFPAKGEPTRPALMICRRCPSRVPCLEFALDGNDTYGIWGGLLREERHRAAIARVSGRSTEAIIAAADARQDAVHARAARRYREAGQMGAAAASLSRQAAREQASPAIQPQGAAA